MHNLPNTIKSIRDNAIADAHKVEEKDLAGKAENARKKNITENKPTGSTKPKDASKPATLTADQMDTAKRLGITSKAGLAKYAKMMKNKGGKAVLFCFLSHGIIFIHAFSCELCRLKLVIITDRSTQIKKQA